MGVYGAPARVGGSTDHTCPPPKQGATRRWLTLGATAAALLAASQLIWFWETWPVRHLQQPPAPAGKAR